MVSSFKQADRGHVRAANDASMEARAKAFTSWLADLDFNDKSLSEWDSATAVAMVSTFVHHIAENGFSHSNSTLKVKAGAPLSAQTLMGYARAAECWCTVTLQLDMGHALSHTDTVHPLIKEIISQRRAWQRPRQKKEPITLDMFDNAQQNLADLMLTNLDAFLARPAAVHNFTVLGTFTGSRVGEYGQTKAIRGTYSRIPDTTNAGEWANMPLAFVKADFTFWTEKRNQMPEDDLSGLLDNATDVYIRFRYDKSLNNFTIRKFKRTGHHYFCPVVSAIAILQRAHMLLVPPHEPIGVFRLQKKKSGYTCLQNNDVTEELRLTCLRTYPDPTHYMNQHHKCIMAHSVRVTAAVALHTAGETFDTIAFRLRWSVQSVQHYIRDCCQHIGELSAAVLTGAGRI